MPTAGLCRRTLLGSLLAGTTAGLWACQGEPVMPLRLGAHPWPGYELFFLARTQGRLDADQVRLVEMPSASASLRGLAAGSLEAAALTLDEVLSAVGRGLGLRVVAVLDVSLGADVVLARPGIGAVTDLPGRRIGVEATATGAVMLDAMLARHGLRKEDVQIVPMAADQHERAWREGRVDALVTFEPISSHLLADGARQLFSSAEVPGRIVDVLAVRGDVLATRGDALRQALAGHFQALESLRTQPAQVLPLLAPRLGQPPNEVAKAFAGLQMPGVADNLAWLRDGGQLEESAARLRGVMLAAGLLTQAVELQGLATDAYLPGRGAA